MIPNAGLDNIAAYRAWGPQGLSGSTPEGSHWLAYAAISEDSQEPLAADVNIGSELARTNATGGFNRVATAIRDPNTNRLGVSIERPYVFDVTGNWNITKYGYVPESSGGNFSWIDLVRSDPNDPQSAPITLTLEPGDQLQLWCTFTVTVPWSVDLESFVITGAAGNDTNGTHDAYCGFFATGDSLETGNTSSLANLIGTLFWPYKLTSLIPSSYATSQPTDASRDQRLTGSNIGSSQGSTRLDEDYVSGTYYRDRRYAFTTSQANMAITGILLSVMGGSGQSATNDYGFKIVFDNPATFDKANTHELTLTFRVSWQEG